MRVEEAIKTRRSLGRSEGALSRDEIAALLEVAAWAPNHRLTEPWTFTVLSGAARERFGAFWGAHRAAELQLEGEKRDAFVRGQIEKALRSPTIVVVSARTDADPIVAQEDLTATAAAVENLLLAAHARGWAAMWRTGDAAYDPAVKVYLGLDASDRIVAFVYLGRSATTAPKPAERKAPPVRWRDA